MKLSHVTVLAPALFFTACDAHQECSHTFGRAGAALQRGGWDGNGRAMFGNPSGVTPLVGATFTGDLLADASGLYSAVTGVTGAGTRLVAHMPDGVERTVEVTDIKREDGFTAYDVLVDGTPACTPGQYGIFVPGTWAPDGKKLSSSGLSFSCETGAVYKCVGWGYAPWDGDGSTHQACTRLVRADYCGDGRSYTTNGTTIWISDQQDAVPAKQGDFALEAGWDENGAVCVEHLRYEAIDTNGAQVVPACLASLPRCDHAVRRAQLYNASEVLAISVCAE